jgi:hypothetical protein
MGIPLEMVSVMAESTPTPPLGPAEDVISDRAGSFEGHTAGLTGQDNPLDVSVLDDGFEDSGVRLLVTTTVSYCTGQRYPDVIHFSISPHTRRQCRPWEGSSRWSHQTYSCLRGIVEDQPSDGEITG